MRSKVLLVLSVGLWTIGGSRALGAAETNPPEPNPGQACYERAVAGRDALRGQRWLEAIAAYREVVACNPTNGVYWEALGLSLLRDGQAIEASKAFERELLDTGFRESFAMYNLACAHAVAGRKDDAIAWLTRAYQHRYVGDDTVREDEDLNNLRSDPRFQALTGVPDPAVTDRHERWTRDLRYLRRRLGEAHYDLDRVLPLPELDAGFAELEREIDGSTDEEMRYGMQDLLAQLGDGHTAVVSDIFLLHHLPNGHAAPPIAMFPVQFWIEGGTPYISATRAADRALIGAKVLRLGSVEGTEAFRRAERAVSRDNEWGARDFAAGYLRTPSALHAWHLIASANELPLRVELLDGTERDVSLPATVNAEPLVGTAGEEAPLYLQAREKTFWMQALPEHRMLWFQFNQVLDGPDETLASFAPRLATALADPAIEYLVVDLRNNHGGSGGLALPVLRAILGEPRLCARGRLYVVVGRQTFSAAMRFASDLDRLSDALFVGEPTGSSPNFVGEASLIRLPYSELWVSCSTRYHQGGESDDTRHWIAPELPAALSPKELHDGRDPALATILAWIAHTG